MVIRAPQENPQAELAALCLIVGGGGTSAPNRTQSNRINGYFAGLPTIPVWDFLYPSMPSDALIGTEIMLWRCSGFRAHHLSCRPSSDSFSWHFRIQWAPSWSQTLNVCIGGSCQGNEQELADVATAGMNSVHFETAFQVSLSQTAPWPILVCSLG